MTDRGRHSHSENRITEICIHNNNGVAITHDVYNNCNDHGSELAPSHFPTDMRIGRCRTRSSTAHAPNYKPLAHRLHAAKDYFAWH